MKYSVFATPFIAGAGLVLIFVMAFSGCDLREVVEVERPFFEKPPAAAAGFLGYDDESEKLTVCGNCHSGQQAEWRETAHAGAWAGLQASGGAQGFCENCHTVSALGNPATADVGWTSTQDTRYHDVQCESCHGAGEGHVANPDIESGHPIASLDIGNLSDLENAVSCAQCHQGTHHPFAEEWARSKHASVVGFAAGREECASCHRGQGALKAWGITDTYLEQDAEEHLAITCGVCHDPHNATNDAQLRFPVATTSIEENLCTQCHDRRTVPDPNSSHGLAPHAPETALLLGEAGWFPPNVEIDQGEILGTHGSEANEKICATCHVNAFSVTDEATGDFVFSATGHLFTAIPCVDAQGIPNNLNDCGFAASERSFKGCATAGCHGTEESAALAFASASMRIQQLADTLLATLTVIDPGLEEAGGEIDGADPTFTVAEGAFFNYNLTTFGGDVYGGTVHNPFLIEALLIASMQSLQSTYFTPAGMPSDSNWQSRLSALKASMPPEHAIVPLRR